MEQFLTNLEKWFDPRVKAAGNGSHEDSVADAKALLAEILRADKRVLTTPAPEIVISDLSANSVGMIIRAWVATADVGGTRSDLLERIKSSLGDGGSKTPYPRMRLEHPPQAAQ